MPEPYTNPAYSRLTGSGNNKYAIEIPMVVKQYKKRASHENERL
jgi:hypothetical protein